MARKVKQTPSADAASVTPLNAPLAAPASKMPSPEELIAASHLSGDPEFVHHTEAKEVARRTAKGCQVWYRSPANVEFLVEARKALLKSAKAQGWAVARITRVHAYFNKAEEAIYIVAADAEDLEALPLTGWPRKTNLNLYELMRSHAQDLDQGKSIRCQGYYSDTARVGPALVIHLLNPIEVKWEKSTKAKTEPSKTDFTADQADSDDDDA